MDTDRMKRKEIAYTVKLRGIKKIKKKVKKLTKALKKALKTYKKLKN